MNLVDKLIDRFENTINSFHSIGQVTAVAPPRVTVDIAGGTASLAYLSGYTPTVGDVVQVIGRPGAQFVAGAITPAVVGGSGGGTVGPTGPAGPANTLDVVSTTTGAPGTNASVTISGTSPNQHLAFTIPRGADGATGPQGPPGSGGGAAQVYCRLHLAGDMSLTSDGSNWRYVTNWSADYDPLHTYSAGTITVPSLSGASMWRVVFAGRLTTVNTTGFRIGNVTLNSTSTGPPAANSLHEGNVAPSTSALGDYFVSLYEGPLSAGDVLRPIVWQNSGSTLSLTAAARNVADTFFTLTRIA